MKTLFSVLKQNRKKTSFHTPGHNNKLARIITKLDTTELSFSDNLLNAKGIIKDLEDKVCNIYEGKRAFISTNGATNAILTAVYATKHKGSFLIVGDAHSSIYNAIRIANAKAYYVKEFPFQEEIPTDIALIIITSPNYFGKVIDIQKIDNYSKQRNLMLIIDASHASHYVFSDRFPTTPSKYGDLVIYSLHKTLAVATGGAVLICKNENLVNYCCLARKMFHSTSPSYMTLASIDKVFSTHQKKMKNNYENVFNTVEKFKKKNLGEFICKNNDDFSRLVIESQLDGKQVDKELMKKGIAMEMYYKNSVVAIVTPCNYKKLGKLARALKQISSMDINKYIEDEVVPKDNKIRLVTMSGTFEMVQLENAQGRQAYAEVGLYPPGVPLVRAGEKFEKETIDAINKNINNCFGLEKGMVAVILYNDGGNI